MTRETPREVTLSIDIPSKSILLIYIYNVPFPDNVNNEKFYNFSQISVQVFKIVNTVL